MSFFDLFIVAFVIAALWYHATHCGKCNYKETRCKLCNHCEFHVKETKDVLEYFRKKEEK